VTLVDHIVCVSVPEGLSWLEFSRVGSALCFNSWFTMWVCRDTNTHPWLERNSKRILKYVGHILKTAESNLQHHRLCSCLQCQTYANILHAHPQQCVHQLLPAYRYTHISLLVLLPAYRYTHISLLVLLILLLFNYLLYTHTDTHILFWHYTIVF